MKVVVDTNIIFSSLINPDGTISDLLFNSKGTFSFFSPENVIQELANHTDKLSHASKLSGSEIERLKISLMRRIEILDLVTLSHSVWKKAYAITSQLIRLIHHS